MQVAAAGSHDLWLKWIDALIDFEGSLGRHALLGIRWDSNSSQGDLPVGLLRGSTLTVLSENPAWMVRVIWGVVVTTTPHWALLPQQEWHYPPGQHLNIAHNRQMQAGTAG
jgi:hypothetical protein